MEENPPLPGAAGVCDDSRSEDSVVATNRLTIIRPDDWHLHLRDGAAMADAVPHTARVFGRAVVMPNLKPPLVTTQQALDYRSRILDALPAGSPFEPLVPLYLTDKTTPDEIASASQSRHVVAAKLYPAGATTHSDAGVTDLENVHNTLAAMEEHGLPLLIHGEVTDPDVDTFDREAMFVDRVLGPLARRFENLRLVLEHVSTREGVEFVRAESSRVAATITPQHLLLNRNALFAGGLNPHHYCLPVVKAETHREAVLAAATGDDPRFFLGTDSAPHPRAAKESDHCSAGIFSAHAALGLYAEAFERAGALDRLEAFASLRGADFYGLPRNTSTVTLVREPWQVPDSYPFGDDVVVPLRAGEIVNWRIED
jgi:dihydroorotase